MRHIAVCKSAADLKIAVRNGLRASRRALDAFLALPADTEARDKLIAFDRIQAPLNGWAQQADLLQEVHPDPEVRAMGAGLAQEVQRFRSELAVSREAYDALKAVKLDKDAESTDIRFLNRSLREFERNGVALDQETRVRVQGLQARLLELGQRFDRNIIEAAARIPVEGGHAALAGMPTDFLASHPEDEQGRVEIGTDPPDYFPVMLYCQNADVRAALAQVYENRAYPANEDLLSELLQVRFELAQTLGYAHWADYITADKMTGSAQVASEFLEKVASAVKPSGAEEHATLLDLKRTEAPGAARLETYDIGYLTERIKREQGAFDSQRLRPYFPYAKVQAGVLSTAEQMYGLRFVPRADVSAWHSDVQPFDVVDGERVIGRFYLDMWPRAGKYKHAAVFGLRSGLAQADGQNAETPEAALVCNFTRPTGEDPGLLLHKNVITFFHEFGHLMHFLLAGEQRYYEQAAFRVEWDFVEVPSQLFEEWAWDYNVLATFAHHHETGEVIPAALVQSLRDAERLGKASRILRQIFLATYSLEIHRRDPKAVDPKALAVELRAGLTFLEEPESTHFYTSFGHLNGYSALYYTYLWSQVIAKDMWSAFESQPMERETANAYRNQVLAPGGRLGAAALIEGFLGRESQFDAWNAWLESN